MMKRSNSKGWSHQNSVTLRLGFSVRDQEDSRLVTSFVKQLTEGLDRVGGISDPMDPGLECDRIVGIEVDIQSFPLEGKGA